MKVLILGAGASVPAGYPSAAELIADVASEAQRTVLDNFRSAWAAWETYTNEAPEPLQRLLRNPNAEVVLSIPDLLEIATVEEDEWRRRAAFKAWELEGESALGLWQDYLNSRHREEFVAARRAAARFRECLRWYFVRKSYLDADQPGLSSPVVSWTESAV